MVGHSNGPPPPEALPTVDVYNNGGDDNPSKDILLKPLALTKQEKSNLVAFLKTITGDNVKQLEKEAREAFFVPDVY